jgi:hypothetical protein
MLIVEKPAIPLDDLQDVMEMTQKIETQISLILAENDLTLSMSALMSATINCMLAQCKSIEQVIFYRNIFMQILDASIKNIKIEKK